MRLVLLGVSIAMRRLSWREMGRREESFVCVWLVCGECVVERGKRKRERSPYSVW